MKRIFKTFTFWFTTISIASIIFNLANLDDMNIVLIGLNPILNMFSSSDVCCDIINAFPYMWHILSFITMTGYGLLLDFIIRRKGA